MTLKLSTKVRNAMLGDAEPTINIIVANTLAIVDGGAGDDTITDSGSGFVAAGFKTGDTVYIKGSAADDGSYTCTGVTAGTLSFATGSFTGEAAGTIFAVASAKGGSLRDIFQNGVIELYTGTQPTDADSATTGTLLGTFTLSSGSFSAGTETNGLEFGEASSGELEKASTETWSMSAVATGTAGWFRLKGNATDAGGVSTALPRIDGSVGTSGSDLNMSSTSITSGNTYTIDSFKFTLPEYYGA